MKICINHRLCGCIIEEPHLALPVGVHTIVSFRTPYNTVD